MTQSVWPPEDALTLLRAVLAAVESGELEATSGHARALLRRLEGAAMALEALEAKP
jgi:hypothetical protein